MSNVIERLDNAEKRSSEVEVRAHRALTPRTPPPPQPNGQGTQQSVGEQTISDKRGSVPGKLSPRPFLCKDRHRGSLSERFPQGLPVNVSLVLPDTDQTQQAVTVSFTDDQGDSQDAFSTFFEVLFGAKTGIAPESAWDPVMFSVFSETTRSGLQENLRKTLLDKYEFKDDLVPLGPPKLNKVIVATQKSNSSLLKRDEHQVSS